MYIFIIIIFNILLNNILKMIIHINGVQGSGKSYICNKLKKKKNIICIDTDDIQLQAYKNIRKKQL